MFLAYSTKFKSSTVIDNRCHWYKPKPFRQKLSGFHCSKHKHSVRRKRHSKYDMLGGFNFLELRKIYVRPRKPLFIPLYEISISIMCTLFLAKLNFSKWKPIES